MEKLAVECLRCGYRRSLSARPSSRVDGGECPRCRYVGWAPSSALTEFARGRLREQPPEGRGASFTRAGVP